MEDTQSKITGCPEGMGAKSRSLMAPRCQKAGPDRAWQQRSHESSLFPPGWAKRELPNPQQETRRATTIMTLAQNWFCQRISMEGRLQYRRSLIYI